MIFGAFFLLLILFCIGLIFSFADSRLLENTDISLFIIVLLLYGLALLSLCMLVASLMSTSQRASLFMFLLLLVAYLLPSWSQLLPKVGYTGVTLLFAKVFAFCHCTITVQVSSFVERRPRTKFTLQIACAYMFSMEMQDDGVTWTTMGASPLKNDGFGGVTECVIYLITQIVCFNPVHERNSRTLQILYFLLSLYFERVTLSKYGAKLPW